MTATAPTLPVLQVQQLCFAYPDRPLWQGWSQDLGPGLALVCGGDGSGKSTLLRLLAGQLRPQGGRLLLAGCDAQAQGQAYRAQVAWVDPRDPGADGQGSPVQWLAGLPARFPHWDAAQWQQHVRGWELEAHLAKPWSALSTGSRRKCWMAAALASGAPLTLIDEPEAGLDRPSRHYLQQALAALAGSPRLIVVAHWEALPGVPWGQRVDLAG